MAIIISISASVNPIGNIDHFSPRINHNPERPISYNLQPAGDFLLLVPESVESVSLRGLPLL